jgi:hypothetical protein
MVRPPLCSTLNLDFRSNCTAAFDLMIIKLISILCDQKDSNTFPNLKTENMMAYCQFKVAHSGPRSLIQFRNHFSQTIGRIGRGISPLQGRHLHTAQHKHRVNAHTHTQTSMSWVEFEPTIPVSERAKTVHAVYRAATVSGPVPLHPPEILY